MRLPLPIPGIAMTNLGLLTQPLYIYSTPNFSRKYSSGQNLVKDDCNRFNPTKTASANQFMCTKIANTTLVVINNPATARTILSFISIYFSWLNKFFNSNYVCINRANPFNALIKLINSIQ